MNIFSSGYFIPLRLCDLSISCIRTASLQSRSAFLVYLGGAYRQSLGNHFSLYYWYLYFDILPPFIFVISMFNIIAHRLFIGSLQCLCASWPPLCFSTSFLFIPHANFLHIFPLYPCVHPYVLHHPSPYVWRALYLEVHIYLEVYICLEGSSLV